MHKKLIRKSALVLTIAAIGTTTIGGGYTVSANESTSVVSNVENEEVPKELVGMDQFILLKENKLLELDEIKAIEHGFSEEAINFVNENISKMNNLIVNHNAVLNVENLSVSTSFSKARAVGQSKIESTWYGVTKIYMNSQETQELIQAFSNIGDVATFGGLTGFIKGSLANRISAASAIIGASATITRMQIQSADSGRGIIMHISPTVVGTTVHNTVWYTSQ